MWLSDAIVHTKLGVQQAMTASPSCPACCLVLVRHRPRLLPNASRDCSPGQRSTLLAFFFFAYWLGTKYRWRLSGSRSRSNPGPQAIPSPSLPFPPSPHKLSPERQLGLAFGHLVHTYRSAVCVHDTVILATGVGRRGVVRKLAHCVCL